MSKHERWLVYPLLFFCLLYMLGGQTALNAREEIFERIITRKLIVANDDADYLLPRVAITPQGITLKNKQMVKTVRINITEEDEPYLEINSKTGNRRVVIYRDPDGHGGLWIYDRQGQSPRFYGH